MNRRLYTLAAIGTLVFANVVLAAIVRAVAFPVFDVWVAVFAKLSQ